MQIEYVPDDAGAPLVIDQVAGEHVRVQRPARGRVALSWPTPTGTVILRMTDAEYNRLRELRHPALVS